MHKTSLRLRQRVIDALGLDQLYHMQPLRIKADTYDRVHILNSREEIRKRLYNDVFHDKDVIYQIVADNLIQLAGKRMTPMELAGRITWALKLQPGYLRDYKNRVSFWWRIAQALTDDKQFHEPIVECLRHHDLSPMSLGRDWRGGTSNR